MILSFSSTWPAVVTRQKTQTMRTWKPQTIKWYQRAAANGAFVDAYDKSPRHGGHKIADIRIVRVTLNVDTRTLGRDDWVQEGFPYLQSLEWEIDGKTSRELWEFWQKRNTEPMTQVEFEVLDLTSYGACQAEVIRGRFVLKVCELHRPKR
jgi:hypothetical protein